MAGRRAHLATATALASVLLLTWAPPAVGFGFITKWRIRDTPPIATGDKVVFAAVVSAHSQWIQEYTSRSEQIARWKLPLDHGRSMTVTALATGESGHVYAIASTHGRTRNKVLKYTARGRLAGEWSVGGGPTARALAVDAAGDVYVAITSDNRIEKFSSSGRLLRRFAVPGPLGVAVDAAGNLYVAGRTGVSVYRNDGTFVRGWGSSFGPSSPDPSTGGLEVADAIAVDRGRVFVADGGRAGRDVKVYTPEGAYLGQIGGPGRGNGRFRSSPNYVAVDARGDVYVVTLRTIQKFGEPSSAFSLGDVKLNRRTGTARLTASVPGVGKLEVEGGGIRSARRRANLAGDVRLPIAPDRAAREKLQRVGRVTVYVRVTYTPTTAGATAPATRSARLTLVQSGFE
jgi:hypothetical protein